MSLRGILLLAVILRLGWVAVCPNEPVSDQFIYHVSAERIVSGAGFVDDSGGPQGFWPVGYPAMLAACYALAGVDLRVAFALNLVLGVLLVWGVHALARRLGLRREADLAALLAAVHPTLVMYTTVIASENAFLAGVAWMAALLVQAGERRSWARVAVCGVGVGLLTYVRPTAVLLPAVYVLSALRSHAGWGRMVGGAALIGVLAFLVLVPWGVRNLEAFGSFNVLSSNGGSNLWMGNHDGTEGGYEALPPEVAGMNYGERDHYLGDIAKRFILDDPLRYGGLCLERIVMTLRSDTIATVWNRVGIERTFGDGAERVLKLVTTGVHYLLWLVALAGLVKPARRAGTGGAAVILWTLVALLAVPFVFIVGGNRYHLPLIPVLLVLAAMTLVRCSEFRAGRRSSAGGAA